MANRTATEINLCQQRSGNLFYVGLTPMGFEELGFPVIYSLLCERCYSPGTSGSLLVFIRMFPKHPRD